MTLQLVLASTSQYRRILLERLGLPFRQREPKVDEEEFKTRGLKPRALAEALALAKAKSLDDEGTDVTIIGCDQLAAFEECALGKPGSIDKAIEQLSALSGKRHELITSIAVKRGETIVAHTDIAILSMRNLTRDEIVRVVEHDRPIDCAGSYKWESMGIVLFEKIVAEDHSAITGLPLIALTTILRRLGHRIP